MLQAAIDQRLDVRMARANLEFSAREQGLTRVTSFVNGFDIAGVRNSETGRAPQKGYELEMPLPIFDFGDALRTGAQARYMAALNRTAQLAVDAGSQVRESYGAYRTAYDLATPLPRRDRAAAQDHRRRERASLQRHADRRVRAARRRARADRAASRRPIDAQRDFWLADAALAGGADRQADGTVAMDAAPSRAQPQR